MVESTWKSVLEQARKGEPSPRDLESIRIQVEEDRDIHPIAFGTSGWRAVIGKDFTSFTVQRVTRAIIEMYRTCSLELSQHLGVSSFQEFQTKGVLLGHDNRYLGPFFAKAVAAVCNQEGVHVSYVGEATTPEFSAAVVSHDFACSINLTPSHNPGNYGGYKFNPADGGPAGAEITSQIEREYRDLQNFVPLDTADLEKVKWETFDVLKAYTEFVEKRGYVDINLCRDFAHSGKVTLAVDSVYGATRTRPQVILNTPKHLKMFREEYNPFFGGEEPEPSSENMQSLIKYLDNSPHEFKLGAIMDPDGDRVRFYDGHQQISMNQFGALAFHYLCTHQKKQGGVCKSVATSNFINAVAKHLDRPLYETPVGFKNFRKHLLYDTSKPSVVCFEESDGISGFGNTLEKDAQIGFLLALEITARLQKPLSVYLKEIQEEVGIFYPVRYGFTLESNMVGEPVQRVMDSLINCYSVGDSLSVGASMRTIQEKITLDGLKLVLDDGSWMLIRPSGTEPKVRVYTESRKEQDSQELFNTAKEIFFSQASV
jgi:phosphomannomutase